MADLPELFRRLTHGVYVVGVAEGEVHTAFTAAWVMQASFDPPTIALAVSPGNASHPLLRRSAGFVVNVLGREQLELARHFGTVSGRDRDKLARVRWRPGRSGAPILEDALAFFDCERGVMVGAGDHDLMLGRVIGGAILDPGAVPLDYRDTGEMDGSRALYPPAL